MLIVNHLIPRFPYFNEQSIVGGSANALYNLIQYQDGRVDHRVITNIPYDYDGRAPFEIIPLSINAAPTTRQFGLLFTYQVVKEGLKKGQLVNLVHGHSGHFDYILATSLYAALRKIPAIHSVYCPVQPVAITGRISQQAIFSFADRYIDMYLAVSENVAKSLHKLGIASEKISIIPPIVDIHRFAFNEENAIAKENLGLDPKTPTILFVGSTKPVKNLDTVINAFAVVLREIPGARLIITTELAHAQHEQRTRLLMNMIQEKNIEDKIIQLGIVDNMPELMAAADVLVAPFLDTNGPSDYFQAVLEAMAVGRPVVVSAVGGMPEIVDEQVGVLTDPDDISGIASALINLLRDPELRQTLGQAASVSIQTRHNPAVIAQKMHDLYLSLVG